MPLQFFPDGRGMPRTFWFLWIGTLVNRAGGFVAPFLAIYLTDVRRLAIADAGAIVSLVGLGSVFAGAVGGVIADRVGRRAALAFATITGSAAMLALGFAPGGGVLAAAAFAQGLFGDMYRPAVAAMVADVVGADDRTRAYGLLYWAVNLGFSIAPVMAGFVAQTSYTLLFVIDAATTLAFGLLVVANVPETRPAEGARAAEKPPRERSLAAPYKDGVFALYAGLTFLVALIFMQAHVSLPVDLRANGLAPSTFGVLLALNGALIVFLQPLVTSIATRLPRGAVLASSALLNGVGFGLTALGRGAVAIYAMSVVVWTLGEMAVAPIGPVIIADMSPAALRASYQGAYQITFGAASFIGPALGSWLLAEFGSNGLWFGCLALGVVVAAGFLAVAPSILRRRVALAECG
jgi:MFS family permease